MLYLDALLLFSKETRQYLEANYILHVRMHMYSLRYVLGSNEQFHC